ncbi:MAG: helicase [Rhodothermaceae bacterium]|nr:helicase [Rhodothermaceae bacterium]MYC03301.1 helicase [Rhodothermaceae bacterium]MYI17561.1 helicase [Rhodothermaceae bacterium]
MESPPTFENSASVREYLIHALRLDLIGPGPEDKAYQEEGLQFAPSKWYMTGFLVPAGAPIEQRAQDTEEEPDEPAEPAHGADDAAVPERGSGKRVFLPSSMGLSVLMDPAATNLNLTVTWGDYVPEELSENTSQSQSNRSPWRRIPRFAELSIDLTSANIGQQMLRKIPESNGLQIVYLIRNTTVQQAQETKPVRAVSLFVVNHRIPTNKNERQDRAFAFQVHLTVTSDHPFIPRYDPRGLENDDWDDRLSDLHYRDAAEYAVGHNVSVRAEIHDNHCFKVHTEWMPQAAVERVEPSQIPNVEFGMETLGNLQNADAARWALNSLVKQYRDWIEGQRADAEHFSGRRREVADELVRRATNAARRIEAGIDLLKDAEVLDAFRIANRAMAMAARRRIAQEQGISPDEVRTLKWRPFQLAYILMNLRSVANPTHIERETVDLLFFPTGGGKTEAYLGLAAFTMVLRRLRNSNEAEYRGLSVLMRYTLRLLTLDQLGRAAALICALELEREQNPEQLGTWPFEIALWVGRAATPNYMGKKGDSSPNTARARTMKFKNDSSKDPPLPLDRCPWCGKKFNKHSFWLHPNSNEPTDLHVRCVNRRCEFSGKPRQLPIVAVDEPIYRRLPALMIATVDKFAAMPWSEETARFFRGVDPSNPRPPDLIIQDELHLISGPLGTMVGLYETAIDHLCKYPIDDKEVRPKIIASTATVRLAQKQIRALFGRSTVAVFPPPGMDRRDSFFAEQVPQTKKHPRLYLGIAAQGRGPKVVFLKSMITLMAAAQLAWETAEDRAGRNPADPYMTLVAYFNALRELGSARRITEDEIRSRLLNYQSRARLDEPTGLFLNRQIGLEPVELTSRVGTAMVAEAKRRLSLGFHDRERVDVALATNMISVGLDITRLGLMVVSGQPKSTSEYIQATSRVGRDPDRPGLVVTLLNLHRPRDRSHYEHFSAWHESFYRGVEATSVTPFSPRALDRGLPAVTVALARLGIPELTPMLEARRIEHYGTDTSALAEAVGERARMHKEVTDEALIDHVRSRTQSLIDDWARLAHKAGDDGMTFGYARRGKGVNTPLLREMIDPDRDQLSQRQLLFRAPRSLRDVEPGVLLSIKSPEEN